MKVIHVKWQAPKCAGHSHAVVTRTDSSCGHGCSGQSHAVVTRMFSSCGHGCCGNSDVLIVRAWICTQEEHGCKSDVLSTARAALSRHRLVGAGSGMEEDQKSGRKPKHGKKQSAEKARKKTTENQQENNTVRKLCRRRPQTVRRARKGQRRPEEHRHSREQKVQKFVGGRIPLGVKKTPTTGGFGFARVWNLGSKRPVASHWGLKRPQEAGTKSARNHSGSLETTAPPHRVRRCGPQPKWPRPRRARRGSSKPEEARTHAKPQRNEIRAKPQRERGNEGPAPPRAPLRSAT